MMSLALAVYIALILAVIIGRTVNSPKLAFVKR
jgi:hypothetical protein